MRQIIILLASIQLLWGASVHAQTPEIPAELRAIIADILSDANVPGASVAIVRDGEIGHISHFGVTDIDSRSVVTDETVFRAGSISKSFTAIGIMQLVEQGKLSLDTPVSEILPDIVIDNPWHQSDPVRVVHLLEHTAGFNDIAFRHYLIEGADLTITDAVRLYAPYSARWRPGARTSYSNAGPVIAGRIIEVVSGQSFERYMEENVIGPLDMSSARWTRTPEIERALSKSYTFDGVTEEAFVEIAGRPSGSLNVTAADLARLPMLMLGRGSLDGNDLFSAETAMRIERPTSSDAARAGLQLGYSLGNDPNLEGKTTFFGHDGSIDGFAATARYSPRLDAGYVVMINMTSSALSDIAAAIRLYLERDVATPTIVEKPIDDALRAELSGQFQTSTPRRSFLAPLIGLSQWQGVRLEDDVLRFKGSNWIHVGEGRFHAEGQSAPGLIAINDNNGFRLQSGTVTYRKVGLVEMWTKLVAIGLIGLLALVSVVYCMIWLVGALRGKLADRGGLAPRLWPSIAFAAALAAAIAPLMLFGTGRFDLLGQPTAIGWLVFAITVIAPFAVIPAIWSLWRSETGRFARFMGYSQAAMATVICSYLFHGGWFALRIWNA